MNLTPERKAENRIAARWGGNVARLVKEKKLKLCDLGRALDPEAKRPTGDAFNLCHRHTMPDDKTCCTVASFLGVSKEALHQGELPEAPGRRVQGPESRGDRTPESPESRIQSPESRVGGEGQRAKGKTAGGWRTGRKERAAHGPARTGADEHGRGGDAVDALYELTLDLLKARVMAMPAVQRAEFMQYLGRVCRERGL